MVSFWRGGVILLAFLMMVEGRLRTRDPVEIQDVLSGNFDIKRVGEGHLDVFPSSKPQTADSGRNSVDGADKNNDSLRNDDSVDSNNNTYGRCVDDDDDDDMLEQVEFSNSKADADTGVDPTEVRALIYQEYIQQVQQPQGQGGNLEAPRFATLHKPKHVPPYPHQIPDWKRGNPSWKPGQFWPKTGRYSNEWNWLGGNTPPERNSCKDRDTPSWSGTLETNRPDYLPILAPEAVKNSGYCADLLAGLMKKKGERARHTLTLTEKTEGEAEDDEMDETEYRNVRKGCGSEVVANAGWPMLEWFGNCREEDTVAAKMQLWQGTQTELREVSYASTPIHRGNDDTQCLAADWLEDRMDHWFNRTKDECGTKCNKITHGFPMQRMLRYEDGAATAGSSGFIAHCSGYVSYVYNARQIQGKYPHTLRVSAWGSPLLTDPIDNPEDLRPGDPIVMLDATCGWREHSADCKTHCENKVWKTRVKGKWVPQRGCRAHQCRESTAPHIVLFRRWVKPSTSGKKLRCRKCPRRGTCPGKKNGRMETCQFETSATPVVANNVKVFNERVDGEMWMEVWQMGGGVDAGFGRSRGVKKNDYWTWSRAQGYRHQQLDGTYKNCSHWQYGMIWGGPRKVRLRCPSIVPAGFRLVRGKREQPSGMNEKPQQSTAACAAAARWLGISGTVMWNGDLRHPVVEKNLPFLPPGCVYYKRFDKFVLNVAHHNTCPTSPKQTCKKNCAPPPKCPEGKCAMRQGRCCEYTCDNWPVGALNTAAAGTWPASAPDCSNAYCVKSN